MEKSNNRSSKSGLDRTVQFLTILFAVLTAGSVAIAAIHPPWRIFASAASVFFALSALGCLVGKLIADRIRAQLLRIDARIDEGITAINARLDDHASRVTAAETLLRTRASAEAMKQTKEQLSRMSDVVKTRASGDAMVATRAALDKSKEKLNLLDIKLGRIERARKTFHVHSRILSETDIKALLDDWATPLGVNHSRSSLRYLADRIASLEHASAGRLATDVQTVIARIIAAQGVKSKHNDILEIGTLFGIAAGALFDACRYQFETVSLTLIDPLEGYYDRSQADIITSVPVIREVLEQNLARMSVPKESVTIIQALSESPAAKSAIGDRKFDFLAIDGDHSYDGVKRDFENYLDHMRPGGLIIFDDYDTSDWPEIKNYVDTEILPRDNLEKIATGFRTALFRVLPTN